MVYRAYPLPYGFILGTTADDGMNVDCFVLTKDPLCTGQIVECEPIALMEQFEDGKEDHNVIAIMHDGEANIEEGLRETLVEFVTHVFDHIPGKQISAGAFLGRDAAFRHILTHTDRVHDSA